MKNLKLLVLCIFLWTAIVNCKPDSKKDETLGGALALLGLAMNDDIYDQAPPPKIIQGSPNTVLAAHASSQMVLSLLIHVPYYTAGLFGNASWYINGIESNQFTVENTSPMTIFCTNAGMVDVVGVFRLLPTTILEAQRRML